MKGGIKIFVILVAVIVTGLVIAVAYIEKYSWTNVLRKNSEKHGLKFTSGDKSKVEGEYKGFLIEISDRINNSGYDVVKGTNIKMKLAEPVDFELLIAKAGFNEQLIYGFKDLQIGDPPFDEQFIIKGNIPDKVGDILVMDIRQEMINRSELITELRISQDSIKYKNIHVFKNVKTLDYIIEIMYKIAKNISEL